MQFVRSHPLRRRHLLLRPTNKRHTPIPVPHNLLELRYPLWLARDLHLSQTTPVLDPDRTQPSSDLCHGGAAAELLDDVKFHLSRIEYWQELLAKSLAGASYAGLMRRGCTLANNVARSGLQRRCSRAVVIFSFNCVSTDLAPDFGWEVKETALL